MADPQLEAQITELARRALAAARALANLPTARKDAVLRAIARLLQERAPELIAANARDLEAGAAAGLSGAMLDRLKLTPERLAGIAQGVLEVVALPDPVGAELEAHTHPKGFRIRKVRVPIGVVGIVYESRPNVTIDCAVLCLKSGNATILRGGKEAIHSNRALAAIIAEALAAEGVTPDAVQIIPTTDRAALEILLKLDAYVHCLIPRGGEALIRFVAEHARMPVIKHYKGVCNVYVHAAADLAMAEAIILNAKCQRPGVCNAAENLLVDRAVLDSHLPRLARALVAAKVELRVDAAAAAVLAREGIPHRLATEDDYFAEFLDLILAVKTVDGPGAAIATVNHYGSAHSDSIVTADTAVAQRFLAEVDSATVYWNVSTRFTDGFEFGLGAEIGISTDRLHARGPMGLSELCTYKFQIVGDGQVR